MDLWLNRLAYTVPAGLKTPAEVARFELEKALPDRAFILKLDQILKCFVAVVKVNRYRWIRNLTRESEQE